MSLGGQCGTLFAYGEPMFRTTTALSLLVAGTVSAQHPSIEVLDLLAPERVAAREGEPNLVRRTRMEQDKPTHHVVSGEGHLLQAALPFFDERSLTATLSLLPTPYRQPLDFVRLGERVQLRTPAPEQLEAALTTIRGGMPARITCSLKIDRIVAGKELPILSGTEAFSNGETLTLGDVQVDSLVTDLEVEIAQAAPMGNPVSLEITRGASAQLRVRRLPGRDDAIVEIVSRVAAPFAAPPIPAGKVTGSFDRVATSFEEAGLVFRAARGEESQHEWTASDGSVLRLSCQVNWPQVAKDSASVLSTPLLHAPVLGFRSAKRYEPSEYREAMPVADFVLETVQAGDDGRDASVRLIGGKSGSRLLVMKDKDARGEVKRMFDQVSAMLQPTSVALEVFDVPNGTEVSATGAAPAGAKTLVQLHGPGIVGLPSCFASGHERSVVHDWDVEVAQGARIADPKVRMNEDGWFATLKVQPAIAGRSRRVEVALDIDRFVDLRKLVVPISAKMIAATESSTTMMPADTVAVEQVVMRKVHLGKTLNLDAAGNAMLRQAAPSLLGAGRELVVRLRVK